MIIAFLISAMTFLLSFVYLKIPMSRFKYNFISPIVLVSIFVILYMIIGFEAFWKGRYDFIGVNFSSTLNKLYKVTYIFEMFFLVFFVIFYYYFKRNDKNSIFYDYKPKVYNFYIFVLIMAVYAVFSINGIRAPAVHNLIILFFNAAIIVVSYAYINKMRGSLFLLALISILIVYMGFRFRLIFLFLPIILSFFIFNKLSTYRIFKYSVATILSVSLVSLVGVTRKYSEGLQLDRLEGMGFFDIIIQGLFNDTSTVLTSGAVINWLENTERFAYFKQIWYVLSYFIPNDLYPNKEYSPIFSYVSILTGQPNNESGAAVLGFVEYYHTAGYFGVVLFALAFSILLSKFFRRMIVSNSRYDHFAYFVLITWFVNSLTRGYLPQNTQDFISILIGLYLIRKFSNAFHVGYSK